MNQATLEGIANINSLAGAGVKLDAIIGRMANEIHPPLQMQDNHAFVCIDIDAPRPGGHRIPEDQPLPCIPVVLNFEDVVNLQRLNDGVFQSIIFDWSVIDKLVSPYGIFILLKSWYRLLGWGGKLWIRGVFRSADIHVGTFYKNLYEETGIHAWQPIASDLLHEAQYKKFGEQLLTEGAKAGFSVFRAGRVKDGVYPIKNANHTNGEQAYYVLTK